MRKTVIRIVVLGLVLGVISVPGAQAGRKKAPKKTERTQEFAYSGSAGAQVETVSFLNCVEAMGTTSACFELKPLPGEEYLSLAFTDQSGTPVSFVVRIDHSDTGTNYCGSTNSPIQLNGTDHVDVIVATAGLPGCQGIATTGAFTATFSNVASPRRWAVRHQADQPSP